MKLTSYASFWVPFGDTGFIISFYLATSLMPILRVKYSSKNLISLKCKDGKVSPNGKYTLLLSTLAMRQLFHIFLCWCTFHLVKSRAYQTIQVCTSGCVCEHFVNKLSKTLCRIFFPHLCSFSLPFKVLIQLIFKHFRHLTVSILLGIFHHDAFVNSALID